MKILFVIAHDGLVRHMQPVIHQALDNSYEVALVVAKTKRNQKNVALEELRRNTALKIYGYIRPNRISRSILRVTRALLDIGVYYNERHPSPELVSRFGKFFKGNSLSVLTSPQLKSLIKNALFIRILQGIEQAIPASQRIRKELRQIAPSVVVTCPYLWPGSEDIEYAKAAMRERLPTCSAVPSWDNLSTKGTAHTEINKLFVWNDRLKQEAVELHHINPHYIATTGSPTFDYLFKWTPTLSRAQFCTLAGVSQDQPILLYLCSSTSIASDEYEVVRQLANAISEDHRTQRCQLLVRPHPLNAKIWEDMSGMPEIVNVYPKGGDLPDNEEAKQAYCHSIHYSEAMVGLNTSAFLEASVLQRACIALPSVKGCYKRERFGHFQHLESGGFIHTPETIPAAAQLLARIVSTGSDPNSAAQKAFVRSFLRPHGIDHDAADIMLQEIIRTTATSRSEGVSPAKRLWQAKMLNYRAPRDGSKNILYVINSLAHFPYHESVIKALCEKGYNVKLIPLKHGLGRALHADFSDEPRLASMIETFKTFIKQHPSIELIEAPKEALRVPAVPYALRFYRSLASYIKRFPASNFYRRRWAGYMRRQLGEDNLYDKHPWILKSFGVEFLFGLVDQIWQANPRVKTLIQSIDPVFTFVSPGNMRYSHDVEWIKASKRLNVPTAIVTLSWDNLTTKGLIHIQPDYLFVWNKSHYNSARQIHHVKSSKIFRVGSPFFDKWKNSEGLQDERAAFMKSAGLNPSGRYIVYLGSSANIAENESWLIRELQKELAISDEQSLHDLQIVVRPHPGNQKICADLKGLANVVLQDGQNAGLPFSEQEIKFLFNTLYHSELTVSINTSAIIDALAVDKPCLSIRTDQYSDTHTQSAHFGNLVEAGSVIMTESPRDCCHAILAHLAGEDPSRLQRQQFIRSFIRSPVSDFTSGESIAYILDKVLAGNSLKEVQADWARKAETASVHPTSPLNPQQHAGINQSSR